MDWRWVSTEIAEIVPLAACRPRFKSYENGNYVLIPPQRYCLLIQSSSLSPSSLFFVSIHSIRAFAFDHDITASLLLTKQSII